VWDSGLRGEPATAEMRINARLAAVTAVQKCTEIVCAAYDASGASAVRRAGVLQRLLRDASCLQHHISANQVSHELTGCVRCGIDKLSFRIKGETVQNAVTTSSALGQPATSPNGGANHLTSNPPRKPTPVRRVRSSRAQSSRSLNQRRLNMNDSVPPSPCGSHRRPAWNKGKLTGPKPPLRPGHIWSIRAKLHLEQRTRDLAMFNLAIDSKLRGCDLVALRVDDVAPNGYAVDRATIRQRKTGRPVRFELIEVTRQALDDYLRATGRRGGQCLFPGRIGPDRHLTTRQFARLVAEWISGIGLDPLKYATHSMRRTKATLIYRRTGNLRAVQLLLGHQRIESTVRYLGVEVDDALDIAEKIDV
jgi:hypothetical protein